jgi:hypothetical protein
MTKIATPSQVAKAFNRMLDQLEANLAARKAAEAEKTKQAAETVDERPAQAHDGAVGEASV